MSRSQPFKVLSFSLACTGIFLLIAGCQTKTEEVEICKGLKGEEEILCLRPDLVGKVVERKIEFESLYTSGRSDIAKIEETVHRRSGDVYEYCVREFHSRSKCMDEWLQAETDQVKVELSKPDEK